MTSGLLVVGLVLGGGLLARTAEAVEGQAGSILFPLITTETGKFTFITILNTGEEGLATEAIHFTYATKLVVGGRVENKAGCDHFDADVPTTQFDMMIFEVNGKVKTGTGNALFEGTDTSKPLIYPVKDRIGFLIVEGSPSADLTGARNLFGWATLIDAASGLAWTYSTGFYNNFRTSDPFFGAISSSEFTDPETEKVVSWFPVSVMTTSWYVLPLGFRSAMAVPGGGGIRLALKTDNDATDSAGAVDLDEQFFSGGKTTLVRCVGIITRSDFLQAAVVASTDGGGWTIIEDTTSTTSVTDPVDPDQDYGRHPYLMFKIQSSTALGSLRTTINDEPDQDPQFLQNPAF